MNLKAIERLDYGLISFYYDDSKVGNAAAEQWVFYWRAKNHSFRDLVIQFARFRMAHILFKVAELFCDQFPKHLAFNELHMVGLYGFRLVTCHESFAPKPLTISPILSLLHTLSPPLYLTDLLSLALLCKMKCARILIRTVKRARIHQVFQEDGVIKANVQNFDINDYRRNIFFTFPSKFIEKFPYFRVTCEHYYR